MQLLLLQRTIGNVTGPVITDPTDYCPWSTSGLIKKHCNISIRFKSRKIDKLFLIRLMKGTYYAIFRLITLEHNAEIFSPSQPLLHVAIEGWIKLRSQASYPGATLPGLVSPMLQSV